MQNACSIFYSVELLDRPTTSLGQFLEANVGSRLISYRKKRRAHSHSYVHLSGIEGVGVWQGHRAISGYYKNKLQ